ncbi:hypothetical protein MFLAVUS_010202 [Mucor flavus]|uniref:Uncharacterized protein n=1 Tax=Mucor flavus TaxID=439312 RepID=A0ABP9ZC38_9FUNG
MANSTGASSGIGEASARQFADEGSNLILTARRLEKLQQLQSELTKSHPNIQVHAVQLDVRDKKQIEKVVSKLPESVKNIDILLNNAGMVIGTDPLVEVEEDVIDQMLATNVKGLVFLTQAIVPGIKERGVGHVINIGSVVASIVIGYSYPYLKRGCSPE